MRPRRSLAYCLALVTSIAVTPAAAELYRWVDEKGELHFTSNLNQVPPAYRDRTTAPREDERSTLNVAPAASDPDQHSQRDRRIRKLRRTNKSHSASRAKPRSVDEGEEARAPAAAAPRKYDRNCQRRGGNGRCHSQLNPDWVRWNQEQNAGAAGAED
jgi:hypothetical protein